MIEFAPHLTPVHMLERGVFGGSYFRRASWIDLQGIGDGMDKIVSLQLGSFDKLRNAYGVRAGETYQAWMAAGWIFPEDPLGWFHWYCRYNAGRRHERDAHQIRRWHRYGQRWGRFARRQMLIHGDASSVVKQGLLQWAYEPMVVLHW